MTLLSTVLPGIKTGATCIMVADVSGGTLPAQRILTATVAATAGAVNVTISSDAAGTVIKPGTTLSFLNSALQTRIAVQMTATTDTTLGTSGISVPCLPIAAAIPINSVGVWFIAAAPVLGIRSFNINAAPNNVDLTGTDITVGVATGRTRIAVSADVEFVERPLNAPTSLLKRAFYGSTDNTANLWTMFQREDGELMYGLALWGLNSSTNGYNSYAMHTATCNFQGNTFTYLRAS